MTFGLRMQDVPCSHHSFILYLTDSSSTGFLASRVDEREVREQAGERGEGTAGISGGSFQSTCFLQNFANH